MKARRVDPFARYPEITEFIVLLPAAILEDEEKREILLDRMEAAFPESSFRAVQCERLRDPEGEPLIVSDPLVVPMIGSAGDGSQPEPMRRRPSDIRMAEITSALAIFLTGEKALS